MKRVIEVVECSFGRDHPRTLATIDQLVVKLIDLERGSAACAILQERCAAARSTGNDALVAEYERRLSFFENSDKD
jgi:hypothetical protein